MSGGSMDYLYLRVRDATFHTNSPEREAFRKHLMLVANALRSIEWNDSGDGDDQEVPNILACISPAASENDRLRAENAELQRSFDDGYQVLEATQQANDKLRADNELLREENERLRAALDRLARLGNEPNFGNSLGNVIARKALEGKP